MPVACGNTVLVGSAGSVSVTPAGTSVCLKDFTDFPAASPGVITLPEGHGFLVGDAVKFSVEGDAKLVTGLVAGTEYFVVELNKPSKAKVSATQGGTPVDFTQTLTEDSSGHINMKLSDFQTVCNVTAYDLSLDREQIETTSLSCNPCDTGDTDGLAPFKTYQPGYIDGTGSMTVQFDASQTTISSRLLKSSLAKDQTGAQVRLYINTVCSGGEIDNNASGYIEAPVTILGFSFGVSPDEVTTATVNFALRGQPTAFTL